LFIIHMIKNKTVLNFTLEIKSELTKNKIQKEKTLFFSIYAFLQFALSLSMNSVP